MGLRLLTQLLFMRQVPVSVSAAFTRHCIKQYGEHQIHYKLLGPPGTGKSHLRRNLDQLLNVGGETLIDGFASSEALDAHWQSGRLPEEDVNELRTLRDNGEILPDDVVRSAMDYMFTTLGAKPRVLMLDGIVRTPEQIEMAYSYALEHGCNLGCAELFASPDECKRRMGSRPGAELRADTAKAAERIDRFFSKTRPALKLVRADLGPNHVLVNTEKNHAMRTCQLVMQHLCRLAIQRIDAKAAVRELVSRCQCGRLAAA